MEKIIKIGQLPLKVFLFIVINDVIDTTAQLLMKKGLGMAELNNVGDFFHHLFNFANHDIFYFWLGLAVYLSNFFLWMSILSKIDLSIALPLACVGYILIPFAAVFFLHEHVPVLRWVGLALIVTGIFCVSRSPAKTSEDYKTLQRPS